MNQRTYQYKNNVGVIKRKNEMDERQQKKKEITDDANGWLVPNRQKMHIKKPGKIWKM